MLVVLLACAPAAPKVDLDSAATTPSNVTDADSDTDADTDSDADADTDSDADTDTDTDTVPARPEYDGGVGPWTVSDLDDSVDGNDVTFFVPAEGGPWPVVVWSHGFGRSKANHATAATRLASWGFLVMTPNLPSFSDHAANGEAIATTFLAAARATFGAQVSDQAAFVGHSAGGLASLYAASLVDVDALVTLDGVDASDLGIDAAPGVSEPMLLLSGEASGCNSDGNGTAWADLVAGPVWPVGVPDATHCDFESDTDWVCTTFCGANDARRQEVIEQYAIAWVIHQTWGGADTWIQGAQAEADRAAGTIVWE